MSALNSQEMKIATGYQMAYAQWCALLYGQRPASVSPAAYRFFGQWAEMQGQLDNPRPWLAPQCCPACGGGHPVGCCAQDGSGG